MHLGHHGQPTTLLGIGARDTFDDPHLPQRPGAVQRQTRDMTADLRQLRSPARWRQTDAVQMPIHVEVVVFHPDRMIQIQRAVGQLLAELGHRLDPQRQFVAEPVEGVAAWHRRRVELQNRADMQRLRWGFQVEEAGVESAQALHAPMVCPLPDGGAGIVTMGNGVRKSTGPAMHMRGGRWQTIRVRRTRGPCWATRIDPTTARDNDV